MDWVHHIMRFIGLYWILPPIGYVVSFIAVCLFVFVIDDAAKEVE